MKQLIAAYLERWQIEVNHREKKSTLGLGDAQVLNPLSVPRQPALIVAVYPMLLPAALRAYGPQRTSDYCHSPNGVVPRPDPSLLDLISLLRKQCEEQPQAMGRFEIQTTASDLMLKAAA